MLCLLRPRQSLIPYRLPRSGNQQAVYNRQQQAQYAATQQLPPPPGSELPPPTAPRDVVGQLQALADLHAAGVLSDEELATAKARVLADPAAT